MIALLEFECDVFVMFEIKWEKMANWQQSISIVARNGNRDFAFDVRFMQINSAKLNCRPKSEC